MLTEIFAKTLTLSSLSWSVELTGEIMFFSLLIGFIGLSKWEMQFPKIKRPKINLQQSYQVNIGLFLFNSVLLSIGSLTSLYAIAQHFSDLGLLSNVPNKTLKLILTFIAFDLLLYVWHFFCHHVNVFWLFHRVHHSDPYLNVTTAFRLHFIEVIITNSLKAVVIMLLGVDATTVLQVEAISTLFIMFHHTNTSFNYEPIIGRVFIVPKYHRVHHSTVRSEHDSNYGAVLSIWDRIFGTLRVLEPERIGINASSPQDVYGLVKLGLGLTDTKPDQPAAQDGLINSNLSHMIAEAAYYKAEKRNFMPGDELSDWFEAKAEIINQHYANKACLTYSDAFWSANMISEG